VINTTDTTQRTNDVVARMIAGSTPSRLRISRILSDGASV